MKLVLPCACVQRKRASSSAVFRRYTVSRVPKGDKAARIDHLKKNRNEIRADLVRMRRHLMVVGMRNLGAFVRSYLTQKLHEICDKVEAKAGRRGMSAVREFSAKDSTDLNFGANESLWRDAIEEALGTNASLELVADYAPIVQSVAAKAHARTALLLGEDPTVMASNAILKRSLHLARQVTRINETTRNRLSGQINQAVKDGLTVKEVVDQVRANIPEIAAGRVPTIARTEIGRAVDEGTKQAILDSDVVKTVDVVGCQAVEPDCPTFDGRPTCNIEGVPAERVDELEFHINHTGCIVPGGFA